MTPVTSSETFSWLDGGYFLVQTYETEFGGEPAQKGVNYWSYDSEARSSGSSSSATTTIRSGRTRVDRWRG
jgi:hypothetical protein